MESHASRSDRSVRRNTGFTALFIPVRAVENNVFKVLHLLLTTDTNVAYLKGEFARSSCQTPPSAALRAAL
eukprot:637608-Amphidinium_carterae.1